MREREVKTMRVPRMFYDHRVLKIILLIITFIVLSLAILNGIKNLYLGIFGIAIVCWFYIPR